MSLSLFEPMTGLRGKNLKATLDNAGHNNKLYPTFVTFTCRQIEKHIALYMLQGIALAPQQILGLHLMQLILFMGNIFLTAHGP